MSSWNTISSFKSELIIFCLFAFLSSVVFGVFYAFCYHAFVQYLLLVVVLCIIFSSSSFINISTIIIINNNNLRIGQENDLVLSR